MAEGDGRRTHAITAGAAGGTLGGVAEAALGGVGIPGAGIAAGALVGAAAQEFVATLQARRRSRAEVFDAMLAEETRSSVEEIYHEVASDPAKAELFGQAREAAERALDDWKLRGLAWVASWGLRDGDQIDMAMFMLETVRRLDAPQVRLLSVITQIARSRAKKFPGSESRPHMPTRIDIMPYHIEAVEPGITEASIDVIAPRLESLGLIARVADTIRLMPFGEKCYDHVLTHLPADDA